MGQYYSTTNEKNTDCSNKESDGKVDYYALLQVEQDASPEEKKALELHPDRNYGNVESTTKLFAEIQSAYEILSDPQERSWYDAHRDVMLGNQAGSGNPDVPSHVRTTTADDIFKLFSRFSPRMRFSDSSDGFYGGLREIFSRIAMDEIACRGEDAEVLDYPTFGSRNDDFDRVVRPFYATWSGFSTKRTFAWKDVYRYSEAPDRRVRRLMEKENKRFREEGIREFNDAVRSLVAFVRKRDPRYKSSAQSESQRQEFLRQSVASQAAKSRAANQARLRNYIIQDWAKSEEFENELVSSEGEIEHFECVVCRKVFKSMEQFNAHERSKKHIKAVKQLQKEMKAENRQLGLEGGSLKHETQAATLSHTDTGSITPDTIKISFIKSQENTPSNPDDEFLHASTESADSRRHLADVSAQIISDSTDGLSQDLADLELNNSSTVQNMGKAKQKRLKKQTRLQKSQAGDIKCATCNACFPSRNQLFSHVTESDHAKPQAIRQHKKKKPGMK
ncbi:DnaJ-domain-containing protein [Aspergillus ellipticus CBS 707.79]|uniref:DnaJ-domain-containing protein n=1 Tax=Aspergillus ellipticus CBS 707.79 TaxID=1448320 RepID=A0A319DCP4_9EURO|nr:DnaJ-domain-containing protein [Aspergillus ellipticus CBS 707.79]